MAELSREEALLVKKFRENVKDVLHDEYSKTDHYLIRWIRARNLDLQRAEDMLRNSMKWRMENKVDSLHELNLPEIFATNYPYDLEVVDKEGRCVWTIPFGRWDIRKVVDSGQIDEFIQYTNTMFENIIGKIKKSKSSNPNWPHTQFTVIVDLEGFSFSRLLNLKALQNVLQLASTYEAHYPEILFRLIFINGTLAFASLFKLLKTVFPQRTVSKFITHGSNRAKWIPDVLEYIDKKEFPQHYGGTNRERKFQWL